LAEAAPMASRISLMRCCKQNFKNAKQLFRRIVEGLLEVIFLKHFENYFYYLPFLKVLFKN
jgi:hypothetical protein